MPREHPFLPREHPFLEHTQSPMPRGNVATFAAPDGDSPASTGHHMYVASQPEVVDGAVPNNASLQCTHEYYYLGCDHATQPHEKS